jgi:DNA repair photolyase
MRKYSHHPGSPWGSFVEPKINIAEVLNSELCRKKQRGRAMLSSVCDPYQPLEHRYRLTRACLEVLQKWGWGIDILTRSPLVTRDLDIFSAIPGVSVGFSIPTDDDAVRKVLEPHAPPIGARLSALKKLHEAGISTWVFIAPILPMNPARLFAAIAPHVDHLMADPLNYRSQVRDIFLKNHWEYELSDQYAAETKSTLMRLWAGWEKRTPHAAGT